MEVQMRWGELLAILTRGDVTERQVATAIMLQLEKAKGTKEQRQIAAKTAEELGEAILRWRKQDRESGIE